MLSGNRRQRIYEYLLASISATNDSGTGVVEDFLVSQCSLAFFCGERLVREILKQLKIIGKITVDLGEIWITNKLNIGGE